MGSLKLMVLCIALCGFFSAVTSFSLNNCTITNSQYDIGLKVLCYKMGFFSVPPQIPSNTQILDVSFNAFAQIKIGDYQNLLNLRDLNISNNKIVWIQEGAFDSLSNLTHLNLANNKLKLVSSSMLRSLTNLLVLHLDGNNIEDIDESAFNTLQNLKVLNLTNNHLCYIERVKPVLASPGLEELYIGSNHFYVFNSSKMSTKPLSLKKLDFSNNPLGMFSLTDNIFPTLNLLDLSFCGQNGTMTWNVTEQTYFTSVKTLYFMDVDISHQSVAIVLQSFKKFLYKIRLNGNVKLVNKTELLLNTCSPALRVVRLNANKITDLTDHMFEPCSNLTELDLGENNIFQLSPGTFRRFMQLQILHLQINKLTKVTNSFQMLTTLEFIDLSRNSINKLICGDFANLTQLKILYLYNNKISHISPCLFKDLMSLEVLKLGSNDLLKIGDSFKNGPHSLKDLQLSFNKLSKIEKGSFRNVSQLNNLEIQDNQISEIEANAFSGLEKLTSLLLSSNKITARTFRHPNVFSGMPNLDSLDLFANSISFTDNTLKHPPFIDLKLLRVLSIHSQRRGFGKVPSNLLQGLSSLERFYGGNMNLNHLHPNTFKFSPKLWYLDLSKNALSEDNAIPSELFHPISGLTKLIISRTQLRSLNFLLKANLSRLSTLRAPGNEIDAINKTLIESLPRLKILDLQKNTFTCDCNNAFFIDWAMKNNTTQVFYFNKYTCSYPPALRGMRLSVFNTDSCTVNYDFICFLCSSILVIVTLLFSFIWHFLRFQLVYAYYLILAFLYDSKKKQMLQQQAFQYDAFISYNTQDELWVMEELLPKLEGEQGWKLCLHHRDFEPGRPIMDNIIDGIYSSRKTICLITRNYLKSNWCSSEVQVASFRLFDEQKDVLILVFLEDIPTHQLSPYYRMRNLVKKRTYLRWPKPGEDSRIFWQKLRMALENKQKPKSECTILPGH
ncbi:toll-like receptor 22 [Myxocyprinus asiaticus]|uniref:toll-like receptor 22 n=1 Tax=Myxocyprinus asiaticus TaxID=70543 RepID=UPI00222200BD|nr:toll-like receptor 22 [Myxocyprinus asiaticus]XP_051537325.1 toll-like receptor 22 [Myxocyprinus asiaticus]